MNESAQSLLRYGIEAGRRGDLDSAVKFLLKALSIEPENAELLTTLGFAYKNLGKTKQAIHYFEQSLESDPNQENVKRLLEDLKPSPTVPIPESEESPTLTASEKKRIIDEEKLRAQARKSEKDKQANKNALGCLAMIIVVIVLANLDGDKESEPTSPTSPLTQEDRAKINVNYQKRGKLIKDLLNQGIFTKVERRGNFVDVWVDPAFHLIDFDDKQNFIAVVYGYHFLQNKLLEDSTSTGNTIHVIDNKTGKKIGDYKVTSLQAGLKMY